MTDSKNPGDIDHTTLLRHIMGLDKTLQTVATQQLETRQDVNVLGGRFEGLQKQFVDLQSEHRQQRNGLSYVSGADLRHDKELADLKLQLDRAEVVWGAVASELGLASKLPEGSIPPPRGDGSDPPKGKRGHQPVRLQTKATWTAAVVAIGGAIQVLLELYRNTRPH